MARSLFSFKVMFRNFAVLVCYSGLLIFSLYLSYELLFDFSGDRQWDSWRRVRRQEVFWIVPTQLGFLYLLGQFREFLSYFRLPDAVRLGRALIAATGVVIILYIGCNWFKAMNVAPPFSVIFNDLVLSFFTLSALRFGLRYVRESKPSTVLGTLPAAGHRRVAIVGAGEVGAMVASEMMSKRGLGLLPVVFLDDNEAKHGHNIHGIPVVGGPDDLARVREAFEINQIVIALPSNAQRRVREIVKQARDLELETEIVPSMWDLASGRVQSSQIRPVELEDLLGREPVSLDSEQIQEMLKGKVVLVTGAGGSIGGELCRQIAKCVPSRLLMVDHSEVQMYQIEQELISLGHGSIITPLVGSVLDPERMSWVLGAHKPALVFHAAAHKHVPMMEHQPVEAVKNNAMGTYGLAKLAAEHKVSKFILVSTDKAINPTSVMGCTKRVAEICVQALQQAPGNSTGFCAVRFGNVLGSSGSVIPTFKRQIADGGPVTVTHPEVMRYFMTIPESVGLILQAASQAAGGEIFVLDMGQPIKIVDVARQLIELSGFRPEVDIEIKFIGLRPGEKLFEELRHQGEEYKETKHNRIFRFVSQPSTTGQVETWMTNLAGHLSQADALQVKRQLKEIVPEYTPYLE